MKTFVKLFFIAAIISLATACNKTNDFVEIQDAELKSAHVMVTVPFKATFVGNYLEDSGPNEICGECPVNEEGIPIGPNCWGKVINDGEGNATHLGKFTHHFEFCADFITGVYPGPTGHMEGYFVAANGDKLNVRISEGVVVYGRLDHHPEDVNSYWMDEWEILGGTGRFEGATGGGTTDDFNRDTYPDNSFHHWKGIITMKKGKK